MGGYTQKEWRQMIEDKVVADISDRSSWVRQTKYIQKEKCSKQEARKESVTEEPYTKKQGFLGNFIVVDKGWLAIPDINDALVYENKQKNL
jgi:hypothetical protein